MKIETIDNKDIVVFEVQEYPIKPVATRGRYYKRIANSNHLLNIDEIANEHLKTINSSWDYYADPNHTSNDLSEEKIARFLQFLARNAVLLKFVPIHKVGINCVYLLLCFRIDTVHIQSGFDL